MPCLSARLQDSVFLCLLHVFFPPCCSFMYNMSFLILLVVSNSAIRSKTLLATAPRHFPAGKRWFFAVFGRCGCEAGSGPGRPPGPMMGLR